MSDLNENLFEIIVAYGFNVRGKYRFAAGRLTAMMNIAIESASEFGIARSLRAHATGQLTED